MYSPVTVLLASVQLLAAELNAERLSPEDLRHIQQTLSRPMVNASAAEAPRDFIDKQLAEATRIAMETESLLAKVALYARAEAKAIETRALELNEDWAAYDKEEQKLQEWESSSAKAIEKGIVEYDRRVTALKRMSVDLANKRATVSKEQAADTIGPYSYCPNHKGFQDCDHPGLKARYMQECQAVRDRNAHRLAGLSAFQRSFEDSEGYLEQFYAALELQREQYQETLDKENERIENGRRSIKDEQDALSRRNLALKECIAWETSLRAILQRSREDRVNDIVQEMWLGGQRRRQQNPMIATVKEPMRDVECTVKMEACGALEQNLNPLTKIKEGVCLTADLLSVGKKPQFMYYTLTVWVGVAVSGDTLILGKGEAKTGLSIQCSFDVEAPKPTDQIESLKRSIPQLLQDDRFKQKFPGVTKIDASRLSAIRHPDESCAKALVDFAAGNRQR